MKEIRPQPKQEQCLASSADIVIFGGAAGGGKSFAMFLETLRHTPTNPRFSAVFFRRTTKDITNAGGLWQASKQIYPLLGAVPRESPTHEWSFPQGGTVTMTHLQYDSTVYDWMGAEVPLFIFDELTHFSMFQFFYMMSRNRSTSGVKAYVRATCNPDADSWVADLIAWWIDQETGYAIPERSGVIRWFVRINDVILWADSRAECIALHGDPDLPVDHEDQVEPSSFTFILSMLSDNSLGDPDYRKKLKMLDAVQQARLLGGNWKIRPAPGLYFKREHVAEFMLDEMPTDVVQWVRQWDLAGTEKMAGNNPDFTAGVLIGRRRNGRYVVADCISRRINFAKVRELVLATAKTDGHRVTVGINQDPAQAGKDQAASYAALLAGFKVIVQRETGPKLERAQNFAAQWQAGNVDVVRGNWNNHYFSVLEAFPTANVHEDEVDASSGAFNKVAKSFSLYDNIR